MIELELILCHCEAISVMRWAPESKQMRQLCVEEGRRRKYSKMMPDGFRRV